MSKTIPVALQTHKNLTVTTICRLVRFICKDGEEKGIAVLDTDVTFDAGDGSLVYRSLNGGTPSRISSAAGTGVDNGEFEGLLVDLSTLGITEAEVRNGKLDSAEWWCYEVNYNDLTAGRCEIMGRGYLGEPTLRGERLVIEADSLSKLLRQNTTQLTSKTCRERYGSMPIGTGGEQPESPRPCGAAWVWTSGTVTGVSIAEPNRIFTDSSSAEATDYYVPGVARWLTGDNAGKQVEIEQNTAGVFTLARELHYPIAVGDTYERRIDCPKTVAGCKDSRRNRFPLHFRGEHLLPTEREGELLTPGAGS